MSSGAVKQAYQQVQISTSSPGEILVALYDGLFRFLTVAKHHMEHGKRAAAGEAMSRAYAILSELYATLDHEQYPELVENLSRLYDFSMARITHANLKGDPKALDDVIRVLTPIREGFTMAVKKAAWDLKEASGG